MKEKSRYVLGIETSTRTFSVALADGKAPLAEFTREAGRSLDRLLIPSIQELLESSGIKPEDLFAVAAGEGPGYFTGIRIGLAAAKTISFSLGKPAAGVCSLDALALNSNPAEDCVICPLIEAGRGEVYAGFYRYDSSDNSRKLENGPLLAGKEELIPLLKEKTVILSLNPGICEFIKGSLGDSVVIMPPEFGAPSALNTARLGLDKLMIRKTSARELSPVYIKNPDAQENYRRNNPEIKISPVLPDDLEDIMRIEKKTFPTPWTEKMFSDELIKERGVFITAKLSSRVIGYACGWFAADEFHIANLAVDSEFRGRGAGKKLLKNIIDAVKSKGVCYIVLEVRHKNFAAISLYRKFGFEPVARRKGYYPDTKEDAVLMAVELDD